jgi:hypothetical protein
VENTGLSVKEIEQDSARIVNAASGESEHTRTERIRSNRRLSIGTVGDGSSWLHAVGPTVELARLEAELEPILKGIFDQARVEGRRESREAYAFDALMALARRTGDGDGGDRYDRDKVIARVDVRALDRGHVEPGEVCEIAGHGPIPVAEAWKMIDGGAFVAAVATKGSHVDTLVHMGRRPTALQRTVLEWETAGTCVVEGCTNKARIEIDHVDDWADTHITDIRDLAGMCKTCHHRKTHQGFRLGPRLPNGKRRLIPPSDRSATSVDEPDPHGLGPESGSPTTPDPPDSEQPGLFDSG